MGKVSIQDLAAILVQKRDMGKKEASQFVNEMFFVIQKALDKDRLVKVKGLGTFKIIDVDDRESVDVNTGERVLIEGHGKITFTADAVMKEVVNKPFSQFETVVLKEGVDFEDPENKEEEEAPEQEVVAETPVEEAAPAMTLMEEPSEVSDAPLVDFVTEDEPVAPVASPQTEEVTVEREEPDEPVLNAVEPEISTLDKLKEMLVTYQKGIVFGVAACAVCFFIGYLTGASLAEDVWTPEDAYREAKTVDQIMAEDRVEPQPVAQPQPKPQILDSVGETPALEPVAETSPQAVAEPVAKETPAVAPAAPVAAPVAGKPKTVEEKPKPVVENAKPVATPKEKIQPVTTSQEATEALDKYEKMDARIRTGAYRIVGTAQSYTVKAGDNLKKISKYFFGPNMECYLETYNGLNANSELKAGQKINIPKLEMKKGLKLSGKKNKAPAKKAAKAQK